MFSKFPPLYSVPGHISLPTGALGLLCLLQSSGTLVSSLLSLCVSFSPSLPCLLLQKEERETKHTTIYAGNIPVYGPFLFLHYVLLSLMWNFPAKCLTQV